MKLRKWLKRGMYVKRWIALFLLSNVLVSLGIAMGLAYIYRTYEFPIGWSPIVRAVTLQFIDHPWREIILGIAGASLFLFSAYKLASSLLSPFLEPSTDRLPLVDIIASHRFDTADPELNIVTIGGGTGLSTLLRGLKQFNVTITAIVTVGDDGGSTGRLRSEFNVPAPGDIRNCLVALADSETLLSELFQYRFDAEESGLHGHSFGNLFITAMTKVAGSFEQAVIESSKVLNIRGAVLPSTLEDVTLSAEMADGTVVIGESNIPQARKQIARCFLEPANAAAYDRAVAAIMQADLVVLGPGSLYTSVIPNLLVQRIAHALRFTPAATVYVANVATQPGETDGYTVADHVRALMRHTHDFSLDRVLVNSNLRPAREVIRPEWNTAAVQLGDMTEFGADLIVDQRDLVNPEFPLRHDPLRLSEALVSIGREARGVGQEVSRWDAFKTLFGFGSHSARHKQIPMESASGSD